MRLARTKTLICFLFIIMCVFICGTCYAKSTSSIKTSVTIKVGDKEKTTSNLIRYAERLGGYFTHLSDDKIIVKVPSKKTNLFVKRVKKSGFVISRGYETKDYTFQINQKKASLKAKKKVLGQYMDVLKNSSEGSLLYVEREVVSLVAGIEQLEGSIRYMEHLLDFSQVTVSFRFRNRAIPKSKKYSSFQWLNTMNMADLIRGFRYE
ncbi:MAG: DUF4349 domain-containing protein [Desulfobacterales bacterium]|nr:DUF4349 domain-containing protein [Desulfobacterales bacterium]MCP4162716.1 DUF4349 domain-containing protein [Deltaproteobacteria bacterium]